MKDVDFIITEAESIFEICKNTEGKASLKYLEELCDYVEKLVIKEDEIEVITGRDSNQHYNPPKVNKIFNFFTGEFWN